MRWHLREIDVRWPLKENLRSKPPLSPTGPERVGVDSVFQSDAALRLSITENLKPRRAESDAVVARVESAFADFDLKPVVPEGSGAGRSYVKPGTDIRETQDRVILDGVNAIRSSGAPRVMTFSDRSILERLRADGAASSVELNKLIEEINSKSSGSLVHTPAYAQCEAKLRADEIVAEVETAKKAEAAARDGHDPGVALDAGALVKGSVNLQMSSATSPEESLAYGSMPKIPNTADDDETQKGVLGTFELRPGASDVTSYHDFHTLQIAFEHVWTRIFDGELEALGRELYREYVKLKDFGAVTGADLKVSTVADLHRLIDEVRKLSQWVEDDIPNGLLGSGQDGQRGGKGADDLQKTIETGMDVATGGVTWLLRQALEAFAQIGRKPIITWEQFPGPWSPRIDRIAVDMIGGVAPPGNVEIALLTDAGSHVKIVELELFDEQTQRYVAGPRLDNRYGPNVSMVVPTFWMTTSVLEFASQETSEWDTPGRYVLAELSRKLSDGARVTFHWTDS